MKDTLICSAASVWFKGSKEYRISSLPGSSVYYSLGFVDVVPSTSSSYLPLYLAVLPWKWKVHKYFGMLLLRLSCCMVLDFLSYQSIFLCVSTCKLQIALVYQRDPTHTVQNIYDTKYMIVWFYLYVVTCFDGPVLVLFSADYCLQSNEVSWDMKWRPAEADWYLRAAQNIYRVIFWSLTKARNMKKTRNVHFSILQSWQLFWGSIQDVHFQKYSTVIFVHGS